MDICVHYGSICGCIAVYMDGDMHVWADVWMDNIWMYRLIYGWIIWVYGWILDEYGWTYGCRGV